MPTNQNPATDRRPHDSSRICPFDWCTIDHLDDWMNDDNGDAARFHAVDLVQDRPAAFTGWVPYLVVDEVRTRSGVRFSSAQVQIDAADRIDLEVFANGLAAALAQLPDWRAAALAVEDVRSLLPEQASRQP